MGIYFLMLLYAVKKIILQTFLVNKTLLRICMWICFVCFYSVPPERERDKTTEDSVEGGQGK